MLTSTASYPDRSLAGNGKVAVMTGVVVTGIVPIARVCPVRVLSSQTSTVSAEEGRVRPDSVTCIFWAAPDPSMRAAPVAGVGGWPTAA